MCIDFAFLQETEGRAQKQQRDYFSIFFLREVQRFVLYPKPRQKHLSNEHGVTDRLTEDSLRKEGSAVDLLFQGLVYGRRGRKRPPPLRFAV